MKRGLAIGKFYPFHKGHSYLIQTAQESCDSLTVLVCDSALYTIPAKLRASWIKKSHPAVKVKIIPDIGKDDDSQAWATYTQSFLGYTPDVVFSSEDYGVTYAACMGCQHVMVDKMRRHVPISGTKIRNNPLAHWQYMHPHVRGYFTKKICVLGAESTGTTTLSKDLAKHYKTMWVPEYGRLYSEAKIHSQSDWHTDEFTAIAAIQQRMEQDMAGYGSGVMICDTNATATQLWHKRYLNDYSNDVQAIANNDSPLCYIITGDEIPFEQDGLRDGEHIRHDMHKDFIAHIQKTDIPYIVVTGSKATRKKQAVAFITQQLQKEIL